MELHALPDAPEPDGAQKATASVAVNVLQP